MRERHMTVFQLQALLAAQCGNDADHCQHDANNTAKIDTGEEVFLGSDLMSSSDIFTSRKSIVFVICIDDFDTWKYLRFGVAPWPRYVDLF